MSWQFVLLVNSHLLISSDVLSMIESLFYSIPLYCIVLCYSDVSKTPLIVHLVYKDTWHQSIDDIWLWLLSSLDSTVQYSRVLVLYSSNILCCNVNHDTIRYYMMLMTWYLLDISYYNISIVYIHYISSVYYQYHYYWKVIISNSRNIDVWYYQHLVLIYSIDQYIVIDLLLSVV
jgi:hypothetical protein